MILSLALALPPGLPADAVEYAPAKFTQSVFTLNDRPTVQLVRIRDIDPKWHRSGGMTAGMEFTSRKFRSGGKPVYSLGGIAVKNSLGYFQTERGLLRVYPPGVRFDDVLLNGDGVLFEHRVREKDEGGKWRSRVVYRDADAYPKGYAGLEVSCASCHNAPPGNYGVGLVPGGDSVLSEPMQWSVVDPAWKDLE